MRTVTAILTASALVGVALAGCDSAFECKYHFQTTNHLWYWDFSPTCQDGSDYTYDTQRSDNQLYHFQICGTSLTTCPGEPVPAGSVVQTWAVNKGGHTYLACEVLGEGPPLYMPWAPPDANTPPNGINITYQGAPFWSSDLNPCPEDQILGKNAGRQALFAIQCDPSVPTFVVDSVVESPTCFYNIFTRSSAGCATRYTGPDASSAATGDPDQTIALDGGAAFGCVVAGAAMGFAVWFGVSWYRSGAMPFFGGGASKGSSSFGSTGFSTGASAPPFGGSTTSRSGGGYSTVA